MEKCEEVYIKKRRASFLMQGFFLSSSWLAVTIFFTSSKAAAATMTKVRQRRSALDHPDHHHHDLQTSSTKTPDDDEYLLPEKTTSTLTASSSTSSSTSPSSQTPAKEYKWSLVYRNIILMSTIHALGIYGVCLIPQGSIATLFWIWLILIFGAVGIQTGAHRLWSHRAYKASFGLRVVLALFHVLGLQDDLFTWCRDHRAHHKFSETDADPHNSNRGFFFSHVGWLLVRKHPEVKRRGATIDLSDLQADPVVRFQRQYYIPLVLLFWGLLPVAVPVLCWGENLKMAFFTCIFTRYVISLNYTWLVNSWAHMYGTRPYDEAIAPVEASIRNVLLGEGFHNYHHTFPWDYSASELGAWDCFNLGTAAIDLFAALGLAWDLKRASRTLVGQKVTACGDLTAQHSRGRALVEWASGLLTMFSTFLFFVAINVIFK